MYKRYLIGNPEERFLSYLTDVNENSDVYKEVVVLINEGITKFNKELKLLLKNEKKYTKEEFAERFNELKDGIEKLEQYYINGKEEIRKHRKFMLMLLFRNKSNLKNQKSKRNKQSHRKNTQKCSRKLKN